MRWAIWWPRELDTTLVRQLISDGLPDGLPSLRVSELHPAAPAGER